MTPRSVLVAVVIWLALGLNQATAASISATYDVAHSFTFAPSGGLTSLPTYEFSVSALALPGGSQNVSAGSEDFGLGGGTLSHQASSTGPFSSAVAGSSATLSPFVLGGPVSGFIRSNGQVTGKPPGYCCAISSAAVKLLGNAAAARGAILYAPNISNISNIPTFPQREDDPACPHLYRILCDPVDFKVTDLKTGGVTQGSLFSVLVGGMGAGSFSWGGGVFNLNASDFDFSIKMDSPFTVQQGVANLKVVNGIITVSEGAGVFAGLFPAVGSPGDFSIPFSTDFLLNYNLGDFNGDPLAVQFTLGGAGAACVSIPEPATWMMMLMGLGAAGAVLRRGRGKRIASAA